MAEQKSPNAQAKDGAGPATQQLSEADILKARLQAAEQQRDEYLSLVKQTRADFENYQKRAQRDLASERRDELRKLAGELLPALDNLERALAAASQGGDGSALAQGVAMVHSQLLGVLRNHGVTRIEAQGKPFDPHLHQAVMQQPSAEHPPQTVLQVLEQGYLFHERVLRPASVVVSTAPAKSEKSAS
jgi:molecular chaperone GrpE